MTANASFSRILRALIVGCLAAFSVASAGGAKSAAERLALLPCRVPGGEEIVRCGRLEVPEDWSHPTGRRISLNVVVLPKVGSGPEEAPMVWLDGGPGIAGTNTAALYTGELRFHRERRAVVMFDQRGTGASGPLHCPAIEQQSPFDDLWTAADVVSCRRALQAHADLTQYGAPAAARDLDAIRSALGYDTVDLAGLSYGTVLAQTYSRLFAGHVRSAVFIGTVLVGEKIPLHHAANAEHALRRVFEDCRRDSACHAAFPRPLQDWKTLQQRLSQGPIDIKVETGVRVAQKGPVNEFIRGLLNTPDGQRRLPLLIGRAAHGDYSVLAKAAGTLGPDPVAEGLYLSVTCPEATRRIRPTEIRRAVAGSAFGRYRIDQQIAACRLWAPGVADSGSSAPVRSNLPVLLLSGGRDATTPTRWARKVAASLPNSRLLIVEYMTHLPVGLENMACLDHVMDAFFAKPYAKALNADCRRAMTPPPFAVTPQ